MLLVGSESLLKNFDEDGRFQDPSVFSKRTSQSQRYSYVPKNLSAIEEQLAKARRSLLSARTVFNISSEYRTNKRTFVNEFC